MPTSKTSVTASSNRSVTRGSNRAPKIKETMTTKTQSDHAPEKNTPVNDILSGVKPHLKLLALVIPYSGNHKVRYDIVFSLGPFYINKSQFCYPLLCSHVAIISHYPLYQ